MISQQRTAILKGGGALDNAGDFMMRHVAIQLIRSLGFETIYLVNHAEVPEALSSLSNQIDAIFVLGSIQFSDAWPVPTLQERIERSIRFHRHFPKAKVVFLPATWGAFEYRHREALSELVSDAVVLVRDRFSVECINGLLGKPIAEYCPDLAFIYPTTSSQTATPILQKIFKDTNKPLLGIIPNMRCVQRDVTPLRDPLDYFAFLAQFRDLAEAQGFNVVGISHMLDTTCDSVLLKDLNIPCIVSGSKPDTIRAIIASLTLCVCSRYHGVISCMSHGIPTISLGWHHKYHNLMNDFDLGIHHLSVGELPLDPTPHFNRLNESKSEIRDKISSDVAKAKQLILTKVKSLGNYPFGVS